MHGDAASGNMADFEAVERLIDEAPVKAAAASTFGFDPASSKAPWRIYNSNSHQLGRSANPIPGPPRVRSTSQREDCPACQRKEFCDPFDID